MGPSLRWYCPLHRAEIPPIGLVLAEVLRKLENCRFREVEITGHDSAFHELVEEAEAEAEFVLVFEAEGVAATLVADAHVDSGVANRPAVRDTCL